MCSFDGDRAVASIALGFALCVPRCWCTHGGLVDTTRQEVPRARNFVICSCVLGFPYLISEQDVLLAVLWWSLYLSFRFIPCVQELV